MPIETVAKRHRQSISKRCASIHSVQIYDRDCDLVNRLCAITSASLRVGDAVLIVATADHREQLVHGLKDTGINLAECVREGRYTMLDAREALSTFMHEGMPDRKRFMESMGSTVDAVRRRSRNRGLTVFGEMVSILWHAGKKEAALRLETLWNEAIHDRSFHLHCAYPRSIFENENDVYSVHAAHTHVA
jgi:hypothetical protein